MPQEPKKRHSRARQGKRRAAIRLRVPSTVSCLNCRAQIRPHTICAHCGFYKGEQVLQVKSQKPAQK